MFGGMNAGSPLNEDRNFQPGCCGGHGFGLREDSKLLSHTPDIAGEIDGDHVDLIERFAEIVEQRKALPPTTRLAFNKAAVECFIQALESGLLEQAVEAGRQDTFNLAAVAMFQLIDMVAGHDNPAMLKRCLGFAIGVEPQSQTAVAAEFGVERATISKWACRFVDLLHLVPGRGMRRPEARKAYSDRQAKVWQGRFEEQKRQAA